MIAGNGCHTTRPRIVDSIDRRRFSSTLVDALLSHAFVPWQARKLFQRIGYVKGGELCTMARQQTQERALTSIGFLWRGEPILEGDRRIDPQYDTFAVCQIAPPVCLSTFEIERIAGFEEVTLQLIKPNLKLAM